MEQELIDIYDENRNKTGKTIKREDTDKLSENEYRIVAHCWIVNSEKQILMTQRSLTTERSGKWEDTHGGIRAGETSKQGMARELKEEIGIVVSDNELQLIKTMKKGNTLHDIYIVKKDVLLSEISFNDREVMACKYATLDKFKEMIEKGECTFKTFEQTIFYDDYVL